MFGRSPSSRVEGLVAEAFQALLHTGDTVIMSKLNGQTCGIKSIGHAICIIGDIRYL